MGKSKALCSIIVVVIALVVFAPSSPQAQDYYKDKTLNIIVGYSPGGSFDLYARVIARYIGRYLPGNPTRVVENMPGAGGIIAANHLYNREKPDGLTIGAWASPLILQHIMGNDAAQFDGRKFGYLGIPSPYDTVCTFNQQSGITKMDEWINAKRPQKISAIGPGTSTSDIPKLLKAALNLPMEVIDGYKGGADARLAVESGEVDGYCGSWGTVETVWRSAFESKKVHPVLQAALTSHPKYKQYPLAISYAKTEEARELLTSRRQSSHSAISLHRSSGDGERSPRAFAASFPTNIKGSKSRRRGPESATRYRSCGWSDDHEELNQLVRSQAGDRSPAKRDLAGEKEIGSKSWLEELRLGCALRLALARAGAAAPNRTVLNQIRS